jgi:Mg-chelatase subunit ChlD
MSEHDHEELRLAVATDFLNRLNSTRDRASFVSWDVNIDSSSGLTSDFPTLLNEIGNIDSRGGTNLDVGIDAGTRILDEVTDDQTNKTIILLSDGHGEYMSPNEQRSPVQDAVSKGYTIFTIGLNVESADDEDILREIANATGGEYFALDAEDDISNIVNSTLLQFAGSNNKQSSVTN